MTPKNSKNKKPKVAIIMGSQTDFSVMKAAAEILAEFKIPYEVKIVSAHRTPEAMVEFAQTAKDNDFVCIIAGAGGAAHLPGMVASLTTLPVIGVPVTVGSLKGLDALLSIAQMPKGVPVATVSVDNAANAGLLAARIFGAFQPQIASQLETFRKKQILKVKKMNQLIKKEMKKAKS